jgi:signal transduction histidine kinase
MPPASDVGIAAGAAAIQIVNAALVARDAHEPRLTALGIALLLGQTLPLAFRRRYPFAVGTVCGVLVGVYGAMELPDPFPIAPLFAFANLIASVPNRTQYLIGGATVVGAVVSAVAAHDTRSLDWFDTAVFIALTFTLGRYMRIRAAYLVELEAKAARSERDRAEEASRAAAAERARIARELHDVVSHHVSKMVVQAEAAAATSPSQVEAFDGIAATGRGALGELRRLLGVLRSEPAAPLSPQPGFGDLDALVAPLREAGVAVELSRPASGSELPEGLELCAFRIVQEAITNIVRHARATDVKITIAAANGDLHVEVADNGSTSTQQSASPGHGIVGMRERVALYQGSLEVGPADGGGFVVRARLPVPDHR